MMAIRNPTTLIVLHFEFHVLLGSLLRALSATGNCPENDENILPGRHCFGKQIVRRCVGKVHFAGKKTQKRPAILCAVISNRTLQHRKARFQRIQHGPLRYRALKLKHDLATGSMGHSGQGAQMGRQLNSNPGATHASV
jgi:hypothetical protein